MDRSLEELSGPLQVSLIKDQLLLDLMLIAMKSRKPIQKYLDCFKNLMRRKARKDEDETLVPVFVKGLHSELQNLINISCITEITATEPGKSRPPSSVTFEIQRAINMYAARPVRKETTGTTPTSASNG